MKLTELDIKILKLIAQGKNSRKIARILNYSHYTINDRIKICLELNNAHSRAQLVHKATKEGII